MMNEGLKFWEGVVKDRNDPLQLGRCRVKITGFNSGDTNLPWAHVLIPVVSSPMSGVGASPVGIVEGTTVFGFFRDGKGCQDPVIMGSIPGVNIEHEETLTTLMGDDRTEEERETAPRRLTEVAIKTNGTGAVFKEVGGVTTNRLPQADGVETPFPREDFVNRPDTPIGVNTVGVKYEPTDKDTGKFVRELNILDRGMSFIKKSILDQNVEVAAPFSSFSELEINIPDTLNCATFSVTNTGVDEDGGCPPVTVTVEIKQLTTSIVSTQFSGSSTTWTEPNTQTNPVYPYNRIYSSESGHLIEIDDTPGVERLSFNHRTGSFYEIHPDGTTVQKSVGDSYKITVRNEFIHIEGEANITTDKGARILINKDRGAIVDFAEGEDMVFAQNFDIFVGRGANVNIEVEEGNINTLIKKGCSNLILEEGDNTTIVKKGNNHLNVNKGNVNIYSGDDVRIEAEANIQLHAHGDVRVLAEANACIEVRKDADVKVGGNLTAVIDGTTGIHSKGDMTLESAADVYIKGVTVNIN